MYEYDWKLNIHELPNSCWFGSIAHVVLPTYAYDVPSAMLRKKRTSKYRPVSTVNVMNRSPKAFWELTTSDRSIPSRNVNVASPHQRAVLWHSMPTIHTWLQHSFLHSGLLFVLKDPSLAGRLFQCRCRSLRKMSSRSSDEVEEKTHMTVAKDISLNVQLQFLQGLPAVVCDVNIYKDTRSTYPDLPMQSGCDLDGLKYAVLRNDILIRHRQGTWK